MKMVDVMLMHLTRKIMRETDANVVIGHSIESFVSWVIYIPPQDTNEDEAQALGDAMFGGPKYWSGV